MLDESYKFILNIKTENFIDLAKSINFDDINFEIKEEFHLTIIGNKTGKKIKSLESKYPNIKTEIEDEINSFSWNIYFTNDFYVIKKKKIDSNDYKYSIIQIVRASDLISLFDNLNKKFPELDLEKPFPHVTLYTFNNKKGIGIWSPLKTKG